MSLDLLVFVLLACLVVGSEKSQPRGSIFPDNSNSGGAGFNNPEKPIFSDNPETSAFPGNSDSGGVGSFNNPSKSIFSDNDGSTSTGPSNNPGNAHGGPYGRSGLTVDGLVKNNPPENENDAQKEVRAFVTNFMKRKIEGTDDPTEDIRTDDFTCKFAGDPTTHPKEYCVTMIEALLPTNVFTVTSTIGKIEVDGNTAVLHTQHHATGKAPVIGWEVDVVSHSIITFRKNEDGIWKSAQLNIIDNDTDGPFAAFKSQSLRLLRDSIYSAKQTYPAYNPVVIVAGSAVAGLLGLAIVGCIIRKRLSYKTVDTIAEV